MLDHYTAMLEDYERAALNWANAYRSGIGRSQLARLPQGCPNSAQWCPLGRATGAKVYEYLIRRMDPDGGEVVEFLHAFDDLQYPHLINNRVRSILP